MITLTVNGVSHQVDATPDTPLLYVLRNDLALNGAKFGCGLGQCGACTVLVDDKPVFSCLLPIAALAERKVRTIEEPRHDGKARRAAGRVRGRAGGPVRLLHRRHDHARAGAAGTQHPADRGRAARATWRPISAAAAPTCASCARCGARPPPWAAACATSAEDAL